MKRACPCGELASWPAGALAIWADGRMHRPDACFDDDDPIGGAA